jgi:hypothetical protein
MNLGLAEESPSASRALLTAVARLIFSSAPSCSAPHPGRECAQSGPPHVSSHRWILFEHGLRACDSASSRTSPVGYSSRAAVWAARERQWKSGALSARGISIATAKTSVNAGRHRRTYRQEPGHKGGVGGAFDDAVEHKAIAVYGDEFFSSFSLLLLFFECDVNAAENFDAAMPLSERAATIRRVESVNTAPLPKTDAP